MSLNVLSFTLSFAFWSFVSLTFTVSANSPVLELACYFFLRSLIAYDANATDFWWFWFLQHHTSIK